VYATASKVPADPVVGIEGLRAAHVLARAARIPLVAIGGIVLDRAHQIAPYAEAGAVIAGLLPPGEGPVDLEGVTSRACRLHSVLGEGFSPVQGQEGQRREA
jgi:hypothetical protein